MQSNSSSFNSLGAIFVTISFSPQICRNITSMVESNGTLVNKEDTSKELLSGLLFKGTTFLNF